MRPRKSHWPVGEESEGANENSNEKPIFCTALRKCGDQVAFSFRFGLFQWEGWCKFMWTVKDKEKNFAIPDYF